jgi:hypothetical protein
MRLLIIPIASRLALLAAAASLQGLLTKRLAAPVQNSRISHRVS